MIINRNRIFYLLSTIVVIGLGLISRKFVEYLPEIINIYLGDALWALLIYLLTATILNSKKINTVAIASLIFCFTIELSQLYQAPWIDNIRCTTLGGLVLGFGFLWSDILAYTMGIAVGVSVETVIYHK